MFLADSVLGAKNRLQYLKEPGRLLLGIDRVLNVFGKIAQEGNQVIDIIPNSIAFVGSLDNPPIDPDIVQRIGQAGGLQPVMEGRVPVLSGFAVKDRGSFTIQEQIALPCIQMQIPTRSTGAKGEFFRCQSKGLLNLIPMEPHNMAVLIHQSARLFEYLPSPGGIHAHTGLGQNLKRTFVYLA